MEQKPYSGNGKPFVYAMYAQKDKEGAEETIQQLWEKEFEVWPSERFDRWKIEKSALFLLFLSPTAAADETVNRAINHAVQHDLPMMTVYLSQTALSPAQRLLLNSQQGIMRYEAATEEEYFEELFGSKLLNQLTVTRAQICAARVTTWSSIFGILGATALAIVLALGGGAKVPEDSLLSELGFSGRMGQIQDIFLYGDQVSDQKSDDVYLGQESGDEAKVGEPVIFYGGQQKAMFGTIGDVSDFAQLSNLKELSLAGNQVPDPTPLWSLHNLEFLDLSGNPVKDLSGIGALKRLTTLAITGTQVSDLSPLADCKNLKTVCVDEEQYAKFQESTRNASYTLVVRGPLEELRDIACHIFGGEQEHNNDQDARIGIYLQTKSGTTYDSYAYAVFINDVPATINSVESIDTNGDGKGNKVHVYVNQLELQRYHPENVYTIQIRWGDASAVYRIWHKNDQTGQNPNNGALISAEGFEE